MKYRKANKEDLDSLMLLGKNSYSEFSGVLDGEHWEKMFIFLDDSQQLKNLLEESTVFVAEEDGVLLGMVYFIRSGKEEGMYKANWSRIRYLGVLPDQRSRGIGKRLTELCIEAAMTNNESLIALHTSEFMHTARSMYEKMGFQKKESFQHYGKTYWIYLLELNRF